MEAIAVNGISIPREAVLAEMQYHPARDAETAMHSASQALVVRELMLQRAEALGLDRTAEGVLDQLIAMEVRLPAADDSACRRYFDANRSRFRSPALYEARHILIPAAPDEEQEREAARAKAVELIGHLETSSEAFAELAAAHSACSSKSSGGHLGQFASGTTVPEFETFLENLEPGQLSPVPVPTRYGYHVLQLVARAPGRDLPFEAVRERIADYLADSVFRNAVRQYVSVLAAGADIEGITYDAASSPLVQ
ncbi:MAG: peptidylprolyl isomerase [Alphaproteobacteria bacterium]|nr:peptidylprolyl isomerase [Alphaproteobacteria bacterium]